MVSQDTIPLTCVALCGIIGMSPGSRGRKAGHMCGLGGLIMRPARRSPDDYHYCAELFGYLLCRNDARGGHATGALVMQQDGTSALYKAPVMAHQALLAPEYADVVAQIGPDTTLVMGHTRFGTGGTAQNNANNHPIQAGHLFGTHNGIVWNADDVFSTLGLPRTAQVDSELLFRLAEPFSTERGFDLAGYLHDLEQVYASLATVMVSELCPHEVVIVKADQPLFFRAHPTLEVIAYASADDYLQTACPTADGWVRAYVPIMTAITIDISQGLAGLTEARPHHVAMLDDLDPHSRAVERYLLGWESEWDVDEYDVVARQLADEGRVVHGRTSADERPCVPCDAGEGERGSGWRDGM
jgi:amidophosphoribosyltransferase